jgi:hypothetical protein
MSHEHDGEGTAVVHRRHKTSNKLMAVALGFFGAVAPIVAAYISYRQAKVEAETDNKKTSKEAESGYNVLKNYSEALKRVTADEDARVAENTILITTVRDDFQRQIDALKAQIVSDHDRHHHHISDDRGTSSGPNGHGGLRSESSSNTGAVLDRPLAGGYDVQSPPLPPPPAQSQSAKIIQAPLPTTLKDAANLQ